ncbi:hypothetical protein TNCV_3404871 [Trichonephila clavipes]|nr:hypothetical protein TNCV_3404871 [Trichonephila clavipes]
MRYHWAHGRSLTVWKTIENIRRYQVMLFHKLLIIITLSLKSPHTSKICQFHLDVKDRVEQKTRLSEGKLRIDEEEENGGDHSSHKLKQEQEIHAQERRSLPHTHLEITSNICRLPTRPTQTKPLELIMFLP